MVSSSGARLLVVALVVALGQLLLGSVTTAPTFVSSAPRFSHQVQAASGRHQGLHGSEVTAHFFKKLLNRKKTKSAEADSAAPEEPEAPVSEATAAARSFAAASAAAVLESANVVLAEEAGSLLAQQEQTLEPAVNMIIEEEVASPQAVPDVLAQEEQKLEPAVKMIIEDEAASPRRPTQQAVPEIKDASVPVEEGSMDDLFKISEADSPVASLTKKQDELFLFFAKLSKDLEQMWNERKAAV